MCAGRHLVQHPVVCTPQGRRASPGPVRVLPHAFARTEQTAQRAPWPALTPSWQDLPGVERWLATMAEAGIPWDTYTYNARLAVLSRDGRHDDAWALYRDMDAQQHVLPDHVTFHILIRENGARTHRDRRRCCGAVLGGTHSHVAVTTTAAGRLGPRWRSQARRRRAGADRVRPHDPRCASGPRARRVQRGHATVCPPRRLCRRPIRARAGPPRRPGAPRQPPRARLTRSRTGRWRSGVRRRCSASASLQIRTAAL